MAWTAIDRPNEPVQATSEPATFRSRPGIESQEYVGRSGRQYLRERNGRGHQWWRHTYYGPGEEEAG
jgi:hypothetical protein